MGVTANSIASGVQVKWRPSGTASVVRSDGQPFGNQSSGMIDSNPPCNYSFNYAVSGKGGSNWVGPVCFSAKDYSGYTALIAFEDHMHPFGSFVLLVPYGEHVLQYLHKPGEVSEGPWRRWRSLRLPHRHVVLDTSLSLIQSSAKKLEMIVCAVPVGQREGVLLGSEVEETGHWSHPTVLHADHGPIDRVHGSQALIQSNRDGRDQFELLVPRANEIYHYTHAVERVSHEPWKHVATLPLPETLAKSPQLTFISLHQNTSNQLAAVASIGGTLVSYTLAEGNKWEGPFEIQYDQGPITGVVGAPAFIQRFEGAFDLVVSTGMELYHYTLESTSPHEGVWKLANILTPPGHDKNIQTASLSLTKNARSHLELVTRVTLPISAEKDFMIGYVFDPLTNVWQQGAELVDKNGHRITASNDPMSHHDDDHDDDDDDTPRVSSHQVSGSSDTNTPAIS